MNKIGNQTTKITLSEAAAALWEANNEKTAAKAMEQMQAALEDVSVQERLLVRDELEYKAHRFVLNVALQSYLDQAGEYPEMLLALNGEVRNCSKVVELERPRHEELHSLKEIFPLLEALPKCRTAEMIRVLVTRVRQHLDTHPDIRHTGYNWLIYLLEEEIIRGYLDSMLSLQQHDWCICYRTSLLAALNAEKTSAYALDMLNFRNGIFRAATVDRLLEEENHDILLEMIRTWLHALHRMPSGDAHSLKNSLMVGVCCLVLAQVDAQFIPLGADTAFLVNCLSKLIEGDVWMDIVLSGKADSEVPEDDLQAMLAGMGMLHNLGVCKDVEVLANEWTEFRSLLEYVPSCADALCDQAMFIIGSRIFRALQDDEAFASSPVLGRLMRLFLLCGLVGSGISDGDMLMDWITPENFDQEVSA